MSQTEAAPGTRAPARKPQSLPRGVAVAVAVAVRWGGGCLLPHFFLVVRKAGLLQLPAPPHQRVTCHPGGVEEALPLERAVSVPWEWQVRVWSPDSTAPSNLCHFCEREFISGCAFPRFYPFPLKS